MKEECWNAYITRAGSSWRLPYYIMGSVGNVSEEWDKYSKIEMKPIRGRVPDLEGEWDTYQDSDASTLISMEQDERERRWAVSQDDMEPI